MVISVDRRQHGVEVLHKLLLYIKVFQSETHDSG